MANTPTPSPIPSSDNDNARLCRERCQERLDEIRVAQEQLRDLVADDNARTAIEQEHEPFQIDERRQLVLHLSWGGPSDGFVLTFDKTGQELIEGRYFHADWFQYDEERLTQASAQQVVDFYLGGDPTPYFSTAA